MRRLDIRWMIFAAVATLTPACTYILGLEGDVDSLSSGTGGAGGAGGTTTISSGGAGAGGTGGNGGCGPGQDDCGSGCVDLNTSMNCGTCGRSCGNDACVSGLCEVVEIASTTPTVPPKASAVAVDATYVYWADRGTGAVNRRDLDGSNPITLATGQGTVEDIELEGGNVYWTNGTAVRSVPIDGGNEVTIASGEAGPYGITVYSGVAYWTNIGSGAIRMTGLMDKTSTPLGAPSVIVNDGIDLYWTDASSGGDIMTVPISNTQEQQLLDENAPNELAISLGFLYWVRPASAEIVRMQAAMGQMPTTLVSGEGLPQGLAVDAGGVYVYFTTTSPVCQVMRVRADSSEGPIKLADGCTDSPFGIAVGQNHVYWYDVNASRVKRVAR